MLLFARERRRCAENHGPFFLAIQEGAQNLLIADFPTEERRIPPEVIDPVIEVAEADLIQILPAYLHQAVDEEADRFDSHVSKHHLIHPFPDYLLQLNAPAAQELYPPLKIVIEVLHRLLVMPLKCRSCQGPNFIHHDVQGPENDLWMAVLLAQADVIGQPQSHPDVDVGVSQVQISFSIVLRVLLVVEEDGGQGLNFCIKMVLLSSSSSNPRISSFDLILPFISRRENSSFFFLAQCSQVRRNCGSVFQKQVWSIQLSTSMQRPSSLFGHSQQLFISFALTFSDSSMKIRQRISGKKDSFLSTCFILIFMSSLALSVRYLGRSWVLSSARRLWAVELRSELLVVLRSERAMRVSKFIWGELELG